MAKQWEEAKHEGFEVKSDREPMAIDFNKAFRFYPLKPKPSWQDIQQTIMKHIQADNRPKHGLPQDLIDKMVRDYVERQSNVTNQSLDEDTPNT